MSSSRDKNAARSTCICVFCYKASTARNLYDDIDKESGDNYVNIVNRFFRLLERFCSEQNRVKILKDLNWSKYLGCCENCLDIVDTFCENYHQLKVLELQLTWKLERLANIMKLAGRVPSRVAKLKQVFERNITRHNNHLHSNTLGESWKDELATFKRFRHTVSKSCARRLAKSLPRVLVRRKDNVPGHHLRPSSSRPDLDIFDNVDIDKSLSEFNVRQSPCSSPVEASIKRDIIPPPVVMDSFIGWLISIAVISNLLLGSSRNENRRDSQEFDIVDLLEDADISDRDYQSEENVAPFEVPVPNAGTTPVYYEDLDHSENKSETAEVYTCESKEGSTILQVDIDDQNYKFATKDYSIKTKTNIFHDDKSDNNVISDDKIEKLEGSESDYDDEAEILKSQKGNLRQKNEQSSLNLKDEDDYDSSSSCDSETNSNSTCYENGKDESVNSTARSIGYDEDESIDVQKIENEPKPFISRKRKRCDMEPLYKTVECSKCSKMFRNENLLKKHLQNVHVARTYKCSECDKTYKTKPQLRRHVSAHSLNLPCPSCEKKFRRKVDWEHHMDTVHNSRVETLFSCQICEKKIINEHSLKHHVNGVHGERMHKCPECDKAFKGRYKLERHMLIHQGPDSWKFECPICGIKHYEKGNLKSHMRTHSNELVAKKIPCKSCEETFPSQRKLSLHIIAEHDGDINACPKPFTCSRCGQQFLSEGRRKFHVNTVHRETAHQCSECGKIFKSECHLKRHSFSHKSRNEWKFQCNSCGFMTYTKGNLKMHMLSHERKARKCVCKFCSVIFPNNRQLTFHISRCKHIEKGNVGTSEIFECSKCDGKYLRCATATVLQRLH